MTSHTVFLFTTFFVAMLSLAKAVASDLEVRNGGDSVRCIAAAQSPFSGLYSLDYLLTYRSGNDNADVGQFANWTVSKNRIARILERNSPDLSYSFQEFLSDIDNEVDYTRRRIWQEAAFGLIDLKDEALIRKLPANCRSGQSQDGSVQVLQSVTRIKRPDLTIYEFDPEILDELKSIQPLQYSFLMIHEWLWDLTSNVKKIRDMNRFLHSIQADALSPQDFRLAVLRLGIELRAQEFKPVCERIQPVREVIMNVLGAPCGEISLEDVRQKITKLNLSGENVPSIPVGDLAGMRRLEHFEARAVGLEHLYAHQFAGFRRLNSLVVPDNKISRLDEDFFEREMIFSRLDFSGNRITSLPRSLFRSWQPDRRTFAFATLDFSNNAIAELPELEDVEFVRITSKIDLRNNRIRNFPKSWCKLVAAASTRDNPEIDLRGNPLSSRANDNISQCSSNGRIFVD